MGILSQAFHVQKNFPQVRTGFELCFDHRAPFVDMSERKMLLFNSKKKPETAAGITRLAWNPEGKRSLSFSHISSVVMSGIHVETIGAVQTPAFDTLTITSCANGDDRFSIGMNGSVHAALDLEPLAANMISGLMAFALIEKLGRIQG